MGKRIPIKDLTVEQWRIICEKQKDPCDNCPLVFVTDYPRCVYRYFLGIDDMDKFLEMINKEVEVEDE